jgi:hypothetical protein
MKLDEFRQIVKFESLAKKIKFRDNSTPIHLLHDPVSCRILVFSTWASTVNMLQETEINSWARYSLNVTNPELFPIDIQTDKPWLCRWEYDAEVNKWITDNSEMTYEQFYFYHLMVEKAAALDLMQLRLIHYRRSNMNTLYMQDEIYHMKYLEALEVIKTEEEFEPYDFPLVNDYAIITNIDVKQAAKEIIFKYNLTKASLANSEALRIRYMRQIKATQDIKEVKVILNKFYTDGEVYGKL